MEKEIKKQIIVFLSITTILTGILYLWLFNDDKNYTVIGFTAMFIPAISTILTLLVTKAKLKEVGWKLGKLKYLGWSYFLPLIVALIAYGFVWMTGLVQFTPEEVQNYRWARYVGFETPAPFLVGFISKAILFTLITMIATFGEELGWTGFLTPKMLKISSVSSTSLIVGIYWSIWHYPAIIGGLYGVGTPLWVSLPAFTISFIGISYIRTVLIHKSKSVWTGVILHASHNIIPMSIFWEMTVREGYAGYLVSETGIFLAIVYAAIGVSFYRFQFKKTN